MLGVRSTLVLAAYYLLLCLIFTGFLVTKISNRVINPDARQNVQIASHLAHYGFFSFDRAEPPKKPTMAREPLPIFATAAWILINPELRNVRPFSELMVGQPLMELKELNILWAFFLHLGICVLIFSISTNLIWRFAVPPFVSGMTNLTFLDEYVDKLLTQPPAGCFLVWAAVCLLLFVQNPTRRRALALGVSLACLALTKAAFFYVSLGAIIVLAIQMYWRPEAFQLEGPLPPFRVFNRFSIPVLGFVLVAFLCVIGVWIARNAVQLHQLRVSDRGGDVLYMRVLTMEKPALGGLYAYAPRPYQGWIGQITSYTRQDLRPGGKLADLSSKNPEEDIRKKRWQIYRVDMQKAGVEFQGRTKSQNWLAREGLRRYLSDPVAVAGWTPVYAMRGSFFLFNKQGKNDAANHFTVFLILNFLIVSLVTLFRWRIEACAVFLLPLGVFSFHALFTHGLARYNEPTVPFIWLALVYTLTYLGSFIPALPRYFDDVSGWLRQKLGDQAEAASSRN